MKMSHLKLQTHLESYKVENREPGGALSVMSTGNLSPERSTSKFQNGRETEPKLSNFPYKCPVRRGSSPQLDVKTGDPLRSVRMKKQKTKGTPTEKKKAPQKVRNNQQVCDLLNNFRESVKKKLTQMLEQCKTFAIAFQPTRTEACHLFAFKKPHHVWLVPIASKVWF